MAMMGDKKALLVQYVLMQTPPRKPAWHIPAERRSVIQTTLTKPRFSPESTWTTRPRHVVPDHGVAEVVGKPQCCAGRGTASMLCAVATH
ncbi:hypothetical protein BaRGS_00006078 [Batillaria attramentaria]|uniref:Uncharacterized protein n=1 Tax=Batillaria attramentaria TaxID=370345 RepID=A0ABD0LUE8_9CAEN